MEKIGIIGQGFVGNAIKEGMQHAYEVYTYDICEKIRNCDSVEELLDKTNFIFLCLPTPMLEDGKCDVSILESYCENFLELSKSRDLKNHIFCIKSTVEPGTTEALRNKYDEFFSVIHNPEFLTEANAVNDFKNQKHIILGGKKESLLDNALEIAESVYAKAFPNAQIITCHSTLSELTKYTLNNFLTVKVAFANEMFEVSQKAGIDYNELVDLVLLDERIGKSHWKVPGPMAANKITPEDLSSERKNDPAVKVDGDNVYLPGFSGSCFIKDINAMISWCKNNNVDSELISAAWKKNIRIRPEKDWENLKGRAVSKKE